jgi:hypothetical protein
VTSKPSTDEAKSQAAPSNPFTLQNLAALGGLSAPLVYAALFVGYRTYYAKLGINPEDLGISTTFVLVRSIGFIALAMAAVALVASIVGVLETMALPPERKTVPTDTPSQSQPRLQRWVSTLLEQLRRPAIRATVLVGLLAGLLFWYLYALRPPNLPLSHMVMAWFAMLIGALITALVPRQSITFVGVSIAVVIALIVPTWLIRDWALQKADVALTSDIVKGPEVRPFSLSDVIPVLDVSTEMVNVEWICSGDKHRPSVFDGKDTSSAILLGETSSSFFVRMDPPGTTPIVKLPAECTVATRNLPKPKTSSGVEVAGVSGP